MKTTTTLGLAALLLSPLAARAAGRQAAPPQGPPPVRAPAGSFDLGGAIYLYEYLPDVAGADESFEIYAFLLDIDATSRSGRYGLHVEARARDTKLRSFYTSNVWFQSAYAWGKTSLGEVHVGKIDRRVGIGWDDSFFGNVQYFNGLKLNPDFGAELVGVRPTGTGFDLGYSLQYFVNNDHVAGSLAGRDVESDPDATQRHAATARLAPRWTFGEKRSFEVGLSGSRARIDRESGRDFDLTRGAVDATLTWGPSISYLEVLAQDGERNDAAHPRSRRGYDDGTYLLAGTRWQVHPRVNLRINYSQVDYGGLDAREWELVPGAVVTIDQNFYLILELDEWKTDFRSRPDELLDRSLNLVLNYVF